VPLSDPAQALLRAVLIEREALIDQATDRVFFQSPDLAGKRSRLVTRMLVGQVFACSEAALLRGDESELDVFIDQVTGIRAEQGFHVSTLILGFQSFRFAAEEPIRRLAADGWTAWELITAADELFVRAVTRAADLLVERQNAALEARKAHVERENVRLSSELRSDRETMTALRAELDALTVAAHRREQELREEAEEAEVDRDARDPR
jgi:hypothetical protein